jgi:hypothetical protein
MKTYTYTIAVFAALTIAAQAQFTSVADLALTDERYQAMVAAGDIPRQAAIIINRISVEEGITAAEVLTAVEEADVQAVLAPAAQQVINTPSLTKTTQFEALTRLWLKTAAGQAWAAGEAEKVAAFLSNSRHQQNFLFQDYRTPELFAAWKATGYARPLGEVAAPESIAFVAARHKDWPTITAMDRSSFRYNRFDYPLYAQWAKAVTDGNDIQGNYAFVQQELVNVGVTATPASLPILEHLNKLSTMMFTMMRQGAVIQNP